MSNEHLNQEVTKTSNEKRPSEVKIFALKTLIFLIAFAVCISLIADALPNLSRSADRLSQKIKGALKKEEVQVRARGYFTHNPQAHWNISILEEKKGNIKNAILEIELAIGLLELHQARKDTMDRYQDRLKKLKAKEPTK